MADCNFCKLNQVVMLDVHPIPLIEEVLESIHSSADVVTTLDLASCYW